VAVPGLAPRVELKPAHDELPQPVPVIFIAGAWQRHRRVVNLPLRVIPETQLLHKLLPGDDSLTIFSAKSRVERRDRAPGDAGGAVQLAVVIVAVTIRAANGFPVIWTLGPADTPGLPRPLAATFATWPTQHRVAAKVVQIMTLCIQKAAR